MADEYDGTKNDRGRLFLYANKFATTEKHPTRTGPGEISRLALTRIVEAAKNPTGSMRRRMLLKKKSHPFSSI